VQEDWVQVTVLNFKSGETILSRDFPRETTTQLLNLEVQKVANGIDSAAASDYSFDAPFESDVVLRLTSEHAYRKLEFGPVSVSCVIPHDNISLADALDLNKVLAIY
jgi:hypothetical protein